MDFLGGSLPNVMFIVGILAVGLGLGIELKLVPLNKEIDKTGRIGAIVVGAVLIAGSLYLYLNSSSTNRTQASVPTASANAAPIAAIPTNNAQIGAVDPTTVPSAVPQIPTEAPTPSAAPTIMASPVVSATLAPTATPEPTATPLPTAVPTSAVVLVTVPDVHNLGEREAQDALEKVGLQAQKVEQCSGSDKGDPKTKKHRVQCQNPAVNMAVPLGTTVEYVMR